MKKDEGRDYENPFDRDNEDIRRLLRLASRIGSPYSEAPKMESVFHKWIVGVGISITVALIGSAFQMYGWQQTVDEWRRTAEARIERLEKERRP